MNRKKLIAKELKEAFGGGETSVASPANILKFKDNPLVAAIQDIMKNKFKDVTLMFIHENGDIMEIGFKFEIEDPSPQMQFTREIAKQRSYEIKRELEVALMPKFAIPSFSIQGVKTVRAEDNKAFCEFAISLIYANKGNLKVNYESYKKKVNNLLKEASGEEILSPLEVKPGMMGYDYSSRFGPENKFTGKVINIVPIKDFRLVKPYDTSGAMQEYITMGPEADDYAVAVSLGNNKTAVYSYGYDGFYVTKSNIENNN